MIGVVLSGLLDDGTSGLWTVKRLGGTAVVRSPDDAQFDAMPMNARAQVEVDYALPAAQIGPLLARLMRERAPKPEAAMNGRERARLELEISIAAAADTFRKGIMQMGALSPLTCPECQGVLVQIEEGHTARYRCHTGHAFTSSALLSGITEPVEDKLWQAMRALEEAVMLMNRMGDHLAAAGDHAAVLQQARLSEDNVRREAREKTG